MAAEGGRGRNGGKVRGGETRGLLVHRRWKRVKNLITRLGRSVK